MFFVFNKQKIYSYLVSVATVVILFMLATVFSNQVENTIQTSANNTRLLPIYNVKTEEPRVALTINCAWNADDIDSILDTLEKYQVKVTFFMVGDWVDKYSEQVKKIHSRGHEIGNHSDTHPNVNQLSLEKNMQEIENASKKIENLTGSKTTLYRPPYGEYNNTVIEAANMAEHIPIQWNIDTLDYTDLTAEQMWNRINEKLSNGSIILMHNGTKNTASSLDMLIYNITQKGYKLVTVSDLIYKDNYTIDANGTQIKN